MKRLILSSGIIGLIMTLATWFGSVILSYTGYVSQFTFEESAYVIFPSMFVGLFVLQAINFIRIR